MMTYAATNSATSNELFAIDFNKKALSEQALGVNILLTQFQHRWAHPLLVAKLQPMWREKIERMAYDLSYGAMKEPHAAHTMARRVAISKLFCWIFEQGAEHGERKPHITEALLKKMQSIVAYNPFDAETMGKWRADGQGDYLQALTGIQMCEVETLSIKMDSYFAWVNGFACMSLSPDYRACLAVYYLQIIHPFGASQCVVTLGLLIYLLQQAGYGTLAEGVVGEMASDPMHFAKMLVCTHQSQHLREHQTQWIGCYLNAVKTFCEENERRAYDHTVMALFDQVRYTGGLNERQQGIVELLLNDKSLRDKKTLTATACYRALYLKQSRRTQERDFKDLCEKQLIMMKGNTHFKLSVE